MNDAENGKSADYLYQGIAGRAFERRFQLAENVHVRGARLENGLLHIDLERVVPDEQKPRRIAINGGESDGDRGQAEIGPGGISPAVQLRSPPSAEQCWKGAPSPPGRAFPFSFGFSGAMGGPLLFYPCTPKLFRPVWRLGYTGRPSPLIERPCRAGKAR